MVDRPPPLYIIILDVGRRYVQEDDRDVKKYIGQILQGRVKTPYRAPQRTAKGDKK